MRILNNISKWLQKNHTRHQSKRIMRQRVGAADDWYFPNKCTLCGLLAQYEGDKEADQLFREANKLADAGIIKSFPRNIAVRPGASSSSDFCAIGHLEHWNQRFKACPHFQLKLPASNLTLSDYISIHHARHNTRIAVWFGILVAGLTFATIVFR